MNAVAVDRERLMRCYQQMRSNLLAERNSRGHWEGELSTSALSTATAVMALEMVRRGAESNPVLSTEYSVLSTQLITRGIEWLAGQQNSDGGWGDTTRSFSNI